MRSVKLEALILFFLLSPAAAFSSKDVSDYPLKVEILWTHNEWYNVGTGSILPMRVHKVNGRGNVTEGSTVHAFDFEYQGTVDLASEPLNQAFPARWKKPQQELDILLPDIGHEGKYTPFHMDILVRKGVYVRTRQAIIEISQEDYAAGKLPTGPAVAPSGANSPATLSKLSVSSNPASADIDIDGEFVGSTPSVLQLSPGAHTITLHKAGYKPWQRKMELVTGEITLNPDLEPASAK